jgi:hypothetical protein
VLGDDGVTRRLSEQAAEYRTPAADAVDEDVERIQHAVDVERRRLDRDQDKIGCGETRQRRFRTKARRINDDQAASGGEMARCLPGLLGCILDHRHAAEGALALGQTCNRALRIGIDDGRTAALELPMDREAACDRALAAAAFHGGHRDDRARHLSVSPLSAKAANP